MRVDGRGREVGDAVTTREIVAAVQAEVERWPHGPETARAAILAALPGIRERLVAALYEDGTQTCAALNAAVDRLAAELKETP